jgi:hypothetical protein
MTKTSKRLDTNQYSFDFDTPIEAYSRLRDEILNYPPLVATFESYEELSIELASVVKATIRESGLSRDQIVDAINKYFGWDTADKRKCLTLATLNNYLSKPIQYPIPAVIIISIQHICHSLRPTGYFAELEGGKVITRSEVRELSMGKLDAAIKEMQRMKKELMGGKKL